MLGADLTIPPAVLCWIVQFTDAPYKTVYLEGMAYFIPSSSSSSSSPVQSSTINDNRYVPPPAKPPSTVTPNPPKPGASASERTRSGQVVVCTAPRGAKGGVLVVRRGALGWIGDGGERWEAGLGGWAGFGGEQHIQWYG